MLIAFPLITDVWPSYGPLAGGTIITINGSIPEKFEPIGLYIGSEHFAAVSYRSAT